MIIFGINSGIFASAWTTCIVLLISIPTCQAIHRGAKTNIFDYPYNNQYDSELMFPNVHAKKIHSSDKHGHSLKRPSFTKGRSAYAENSLNDEIYYNPNETQEHNDYDIKVPSYALDNEPKTAHYPAADNYMLDDNFENAHSYSTPKDTYQRQTLPSKSSIVKSTLQSNPMVSSWYPVFEFLRTAITTILGFVFSPSMLTAVMGVGSAASVATQGFAGLFNIIWVLSFTLFAFGKFLVKATFRLSTILSNFITQFIGKHCTLSF